MSKRIYFADDTECCEVCGGNVIPDFESDSNSYECEICGHIQSDED